MKIRKYKTQGNRCLIICPNKKDTKIGSASCRECNMFLAINYDTNIIICKYNEKDKKIEYETSKNESHCKTMCINLPKLEMMVGSQSCNNCKHFVLDNEKTKIVVCNY